MKYVFSHGVNKKGVDVICCVSHFAGKPVRGFAKCSPEDSFDLEQGMKLAQLRCDEKVAEKRIKRAQMKLCEAAAAVEAAQQRAEKMHSYLQDSLEEAINIKNELRLFEATL